MHDKTLTRGQQLFYCFLIDKCYVSYEHTQEQAEPSHSFRITLTWWSLYTEK